MLRFSLFRLPFKPDFSKSKIPKYLQKQQHNFHFVVYTICIQHTGWFSRAIQSGSHAAHAHRHNKISKTSHDERHILKQSLEALVKKKTCKAQHSLLECPPKKFFHTGGSGSFLLGLVLLRRDHCRDAPVLVAAALFSTSG